jgi:hypothetical protein
MMSLLIAIMFDLYHTTEFVVCIQTKLSPLTLAVEKGYLDVVKLLLEKEADVNIRDEVAYGISRICY